SPGNFAPGGTSPHSIEGDPADFPGSTIATEISIWRFVIVSDVFQPLLLPAHNPGPMTGTGNSTYLIASAAGTAALVDAGVGAHRHLEDLRTELDAAGATLTNVLVTHGHLDHAGGAAAIAAAHSTAHFRKHPWPGQDDRYAVAWEILHDGDVVEVGREQLRTLHTPGHSPDHLAF